MANTLFISNDINAALESLTDTIVSSQKVIIDVDEFKIENAREVIAKAYIASEEEKFIIIKAKKFNEISQNALLKVLEESPDGITIYLIGVSKAIFLPTIRSRVVVKTLHTQKSREKIAFDFDQLDINSIYDFIVNNDRFMDKGKASTFVQEALRWYQNSSHNLNRDLLSFFGEAKKLLELNGNPQSILITLFLNLIEVKNSDKKNP